MRNSEYAVLLIVVVTAGLGAAAPFSAPGAPAPADRLHQPLDLEATPPLRLPAGDTIRRPAPPETIPGATPLPGTPLRDPVPRSAAPSGLLPERPIVPGTPAAPSKTLPGATPLRDPLRRPGAPSGLLPERPKKPEEIPLPPLPGADSPSPRPGSALGSGQEPPAMGAELDRLLSAIRQENSVERLAECAPRWAGLLVESSRAESRYESGDLRELIDGLSVAFNVQSAAARLRADWAAHLRALEQFQSQLNVLHRQVEGAFREGAAGGDERELLLVGYHLEKITAVLERDRGNREAEIEALRKAAEHAQSLRSACEKGRPAWLPDAARYEYTAMARLIARTTADSARAREARAAALQLCLDELRRYSQEVGAMYREGAVGGDAMALSLALCEVEKHSAMMADLRGDTAARIASLKEAVAQAEKRAQALAAKSEAGHPTSPADWLAASKCLHGAKVRLAAATANRAAEARQTQREAFQLHRDRVAAVLQQVEARYRRGAVGETTADLAYVASRYLWIRLQIAALRNSP